MYIPPIRPMVHVQPVITTNSRGDKVYDYGVSATRTNMPGWLQQRSVQSIGAARSVITDGRNQGISQWSFYTNNGAAVTRYSRFEEGPDLYIVDGEPNDTHSLSPGIDHYEFNLRLVEG